MSDSNTAANDASVQRNVMPWGKRALELEETEGAYCHYAAWQEWLEERNGRLFRELQVDLDESDTVALYAAFCDACRSVVTSRENTLQGIIDAMDAQMRDLDRSATRSRKNGDHNWENICNARILGLLSARRIVLDAMQEPSQCEDTKSIQEPPA